MMERGHDVEVVAAWPHYPEPKWAPARPYRELRDGIPSPAPAGGATMHQRIRQELSFAAAHGRDTWLKPTRCDDRRVALVPRAAPAAQRPAATRPWSPWLHDILPDGAAATGLVDDGQVLRAAARSSGSPIARPTGSWSSRRPSRATSRPRAFRRTRSSFIATRPVCQAARVERARLERARLERARLERARLERVCVERACVERPCVERHASNGNGRNGHHPTTLLSMGNIGFSQGLTEVVRAFESEPELNPGVRLVITGSGVAAPTPRRRFAPSASRWPASSPASSSSTSCTARRSRSSRRSTAARSSTSPRSS